MTRHFRLTPFTILALVAITIILMGCPSTASAATNIPRQPNPIIRYVDIIRGRLLRVPGVIRRAVGQLPSGPSPIFGGRP